MHKYHDLKPRIFLIHGWGGSSQGDWFPWAAKKLTELDYDVISPDMPDTDHPKIVSWVNHLASLVGELRESDLFVGHSIGCQTIMRYFEHAVGSAEQVILVAPWFTLTNLESEESWQIAEPWLSTPMNVDLIKSKAKSWVTIFSDNDPWVPYMENKTLFKDKLNPEIITLHGRGHMSAEEGSPELPELINLLD